MAEIFDVNIYDDRYFEWHFKNARDYSIKTMDWFIQTYKVNSLVDFGCGIGSYIESAFNNNLEKIKGYDIGGEFAKKYTPDNIKHLIEYADCTKPINCDIYDCVISFETAEHIEPSGTDLFISNIVKAVNNNGIILFSAAPPEQAGSGHINCHSKEYWIKKLEEHGFNVDTNMTKYVAKKWLDLGAPNYIYNNLIITKK